MSDGEAWRNWLREEDGRRGIALRCGCCGQETMPPYTGEDGYRFEGWYCEGCGTAWSTPTGPSEPDSCRLHRPR